MPRPGGTIAPPSTTLAASAVNSLFQLIGIAQWKAALGPLLLPPVPLLVLMLAGAGLMWRAPSGHAPRRGARVGLGLIVLSATLLWLSACQGSGRYLAHWLLDAPPALDAPRRAELKRLNATAPHTAIVVLGSGFEPLAPEYGTGNLMPRSMERLRYGIWLARQTGLPLGFSGGTGWAQADVTSEAEQAARIATEQFGLRLRWTEERSRDTRENAIYSVALLRRDGIRHIVVVTHGWHMPRALRAFRDAAGSDIRIEAAPMGLGEPGETKLLQWLPGPDGYQRVHQVLREWVGRLAGA